jgi:hypothetical protein
METVELRKEQEIFIPNKGWTKIENVKLKRICPHYLIEGEKPTTNSLCVRRSQYNKTRRFSGMRTGVVYKTPKISKRTCLFDKIPYYPVYLNCLVFQGEKI